MVKDQNGDIVIKNVNVKEWIKTHLEEYVIGYFLSINEIIIYR